VSSSYGGVCNPRTPLGEGFLRSSFRHEDNAGLGPIEAFDQLIGFDEIVVFGDDELKERVGNRQKGSKSVQVLPFVMELARRSEFRRQVPLIDSI
jgi:hypothetical protein